MFVKRNSENATKRTTKTNKKNMHGGRKPTMHAIDILLIKADWVAELSVQLPFAVLLLLQLQHFRQPFVHWRVS